MTRTFDHATDFETFNTWWISHGEHPIPREALPSVGFINEGACCFLVQTDSTFALIEFLVCSRENRAHKRLILDVVKACENSARNLGFTVLLAPLDKPIVVNLAVKRFNWKLNGSIPVVSKELT